MEWSRRIDGYCERIGPEYWSEPLNAVTNAAFIIAALIALLIARRAGRLDGPVIWLICLTATIGIGSYLFHTHATVWAAIADVAPIGVFILSYFTISMRCYAGFGWGKSLLLTLGFILALIAVSYVANTLLRDLIGGSVSYVPALLGLVAVGVWLSGKGHPAAGWLFAVAVIFTVSLTARALDEPLCASLPFGTHFVWHILNGVVLGTLTVTLIRHGRSTSDA